MNDELSKMTLLYEKAIALLKVREIQLEECRKNYEITLTAMRNEINRLQNGVCGCPDNCTHDSDCAIHNGPAYPAGECDFKNKEGL